MSAIRLMKSLGPVDARGVVRDPMLRWVLIMAPILVVVIRVGMPFVETWLNEAGGYEIEHLRPLVVSFLGVVVPGLVGTIVGFLLLDQRDDDTLSAMLVTPVTLRDYLVYRLALPMVVGTLLTMITLAFNGIVELSAYQVILTSLTGAPLAPLYALLIGSFAANKVQGFAIAKAIGVLILPAIVAYFVPMPAQVLFGVDPLYWPAKVFWVCDAGGPQAWLRAAGFAVVGIALQLLIVLGLARRFARIVRR
ncbi:MAG: hypothetical protein ACYTGR_06510 [Planctomycetota bacterium]|jgi:fluoroquinolone transport system permease protein